MGISPYPASVMMPKIALPYPSILEFLCGKFPQVAPDCWERRIVQGKVLDDDGLPITRATAYRPEGRIYYFREVEQEIVIPFSEEVLFHNDQILVCCKPHFLPVTPGGRFVDQCLLNRLRKSTGNHDLVPLHRIDRDTAGLVLFSTNKETRALYSQLFNNGGMEKGYQALAAVVRDPDERSWLVENRIVSGEPWFRMKIVPGQVNARSRIALVESRDGLARFELTPITGKTHQLRVHLSDLGFGILNDRLYPTLQAQGPDDFARPLQLLAKSIKFVDPCTGKTMSFESGRRLLW